MNIAQKKKFTAAEYLQLERKAEYKSEYYKGEIFALAGASRKHNLIEHNISRELGNQLREKTCEVYANDMRVRVEDADLYTYPDVRIVCDKPEFEDNYFDVLLNPTVIIEVLSESTEKYDRGKKFEFYRKIYSLKEYIMIAQDRFCVEVFSKNNEGYWVLKQESQNIEDTIYLSSIECNLNMKDIYLKIDFGEEKDINDKANKV